MWVAQELAVAKSPVFILGHKRVPYDHLSAAVGFWSHMSWSLGRQAYFRGTWMELDNDKVFNAMSDCKTLRALYMLSYRDSYQRNNTNKLYKLLLRANVISTDDNKLRATNPRDYIYGLLGLVGNEEKLGIKPDYEKRWQEVYVEVARLLIDHGHVDVLALCQKNLNNSEKDDLPSWTPDWCKDILERTNIREPFVADGASIRTPFSASGDQSSWTSCAPSVSSSTTITLSGVYVDTVEEVGTEYALKKERGSDILKPMVVLISEVAKFCHKSAELAFKIYSQPQQREEAFWRIPIRDVEVLLGPLGRLPH